MGSVARTSAVVTAVLLLSLLSGLGLVLAATQHAEGLAASAASQPTWTQALWQLQAAERWSRRGAPMPRAFHRASPLQRDLHRRIDAHFDRQRTTLLAGASGATAHLDWLALVAARSDAPGQRARLVRIQAAVSYGRPEVLRTAVAAQPGPFADAWMGVARLHSTEPSLLAPDLHRSTAPGLDWRAPPQESDREGLGEVDQLVSAETQRRAGDLMAARRALLPLLSSADDDVAAAAATAWGLSLLDELHGDDVGLMLTGVLPRVDTDALSELSGRLLLSSRSDPRWAPAWMCLAEVQDDLDHSADALGAARAATECAAGSSPGRVAATPGAVRLDAPGLHNPQRVQPVRLAIHARRVAARPDSQTQADLQELERELLTLQAQAELAAREVSTAHRHFLEANALSPDSAKLSSWVELAAQLSELPTAEAAPPTPAQAPAAAPAARLRDLMRKPWDPEAALLLCRTYSDDADDLIMALSSPVRDGTDLAQALAQAHLRLRVSQDPTLHLGLSPALAQAARDRLRQQALDEPLWALFGLGVYTLIPPPLPEPGPRANGGQSERHSPR